jgi:prostaglandin-E synthase 1
MTLLADPVFRLYAISVAIIIVTLYGLGFWTAKLRNDRKAVVNPEDVAINGGAAVVEVEHPDVQRIKRAHINALENAVPFFAIGFLYALTSPNLTMATILYFGFVGIRLLHMVFYLSARQPFRTLSFIIGGIINLIMVVQVVRAVVAA